MRLTDEQIGEIRESAAYENGAVTKWQLRGHVFALLADRAVLVAEIAELKTRMAEGFAARKGQIENGAKMIAGLQAENAKLRKVLSDAKPILEGFAAKNPKRPILCNGDVVMQDPAGVFSLLSFIDILEPPNVPDATDDKNRGTQQRGLRSIWSSVE